MSFFPKTLNYIKSLLRRPKQKYADVLIINSKGELLVLLRSRIDDIQEGKWCLPGGHVDAGENILHAAVREVQEETGLTLDLHKVEFVKNIITTDADLNYFIASYDGEATVYLDNDEHINYEWIPTSRIVEKEFLFDLKSTLCDLFALPFETTKDVLSKSQAESLAIYSIKHKLSFAQQMLDDALESDRITIDQYMEYKDRWDAVSKAEENQLTAHTGDRGQTWYTKNIEEETADNFESNLEQEIAEYYDLIFKVGSWYYDKEGYRIPYADEIIKKAGIEIKDIPEEHLVRLTSPDSILEESDRHALALVWKRIQQYKELYYVVEAGLIKEQLDNLANWASYRETIEMAIDATFKSYQVVSKDQMLSLVQVLKSQFRSNFDPELLIRFKHPDPIQKYVYLSEFEKWLNEVPLEEYLLEHIEIVDLDLFQEQQFNVEYLDTTDPDFVTQVHNRVKELMQEGNEL